MWPGPRPTSVPSGTLSHPAVWPQQTWAEYWGAGLCTIWGELRPYLTQCGHGPRPTSVSSGILIYQTVWPQYTNVTDSEAVDRQHKQTGRQAERQRSDSEGRNVLQTVVQKPPLSLGHIRFVSGNKTLTTNFTPVSMNSHF